MNRPIDRSLRTAFLAGALAAAVIFASLAAAPAGAQKFPEFSDARLKQGRAIWLATCEACHANDVAGAPLVTNKASWAPRLAKGKETLYQSALGGLTGAKGTQMPPRGGNDKLTDDQVRAAVDYMMAIVK
ncbi:MAG: cytochrome c5 family protein [Betaproteobacteria bacterium]|nr:cytochrome c5 family protein [Betaproteobacteria bacterium]